MTHKPNPAMRRLGRCERKQRDLRGIREGDGHAETTRHAHNADPDARGLESVAENAISAPKPTDFAFNRNQSVCIVAFHCEASHSKSGVDQTGVGDYLAAEGL